MRSNEDIIRILDNKRIEKNLSISELARQVDMAKSAVSRYFNLTRDFPINRVDDFAKVLNLTPEYILGFDNNKKADILPIYNKLDSDNQSKVYNFADKLLEEQNSKVIDMRTWKDVQIQSKVSAGTGILDLDQEHQELISYDGYVPPKYDMAFEVNGDSMEPMFRDKEIIFVKHDKDIRNGQLGVVLVNDEAFIKKMYLESGQLRLVSLNKKYDDIVANQNDDIKVIGRVIL